MTKSASFFSVWRWSRSRQAPHCESRTCRESHEGVQKPVTFRWYYHRIYKNAALSPLVLRESVSLDVSCSGKWLQPTPQKHRTSDRSGQVVCARRRRLWARNPSRAPLDYSSDHHSLFYRLVLLIATDFKISSHCFTKQFVEERLLVV